MTEEHNSNISSSGPAENLTTESANVWAGNKRTLVVVGIAVLLISIVGGALGTSLMLLAREERVGARGINSSAFSSDQAKPGTFVEESNITGVVERTIPSVVSITASQTIRIPEYTPDVGDPFGLFGGGRGNFNFRNNNNSGGKTEEQEVSSGTGFFVSSDGLILTNKHVVDNDSAKYTVTTSDGKKYEAKVLAKNPVNDIAIVKVDIHDAKALVLGKSQDVKLGQNVIAIGNSLGQYQNTVTTGVVSGIGRSIVAGDSGQSEQLEGVIQTDASLNPGNSGGPLLNLNGEVIGINTAVDFQGQLVGFALPVDDARSDLASYEKYGRIARPWLGVRYVMIGKQLASEKQLPRDFGALVVRGNTSTDLAVIPGSPADKAGVVENDIILEVEGKKIDETKSLAGYLKSYNIGDTINLKVYHKGEEKQISLKLEERK